MQVRWMVIAGDQRSPPTILGQRHFINCMIGTSYMILINPIFWYTIRIIYEVPTKLCSRLDARVLRANMNGMWSRRP